jgi:ABC-type transport system involved in cytochrome c biogenesis permease component
VIGLWIGVLIALASVPLGIPVLIFAYMFF